MKEDLYGTQMLRIIVSILLIVELAFEVCSRLARTLLLCGFNPSYRGIGFWRSAERPWKQQWNPFQSFLSWNWLLKTRRGVWYRLVCHVSILLIVELAFEEAVQPVHITPKRCFNPSYRGIGFWSWRYPLNLFQGPSFNPSYRGIGFWSMLRKHCRIMANFVSILLIVELAFEAFGVNMSKYIRLLFQSFLSWNWLLKTKAERMQAVLEIGFNPSYRGIGFWRVRNQTRRLRST